MNKNIELIETFSVKPEVIYKAWLSSEGHSKMTGGEAICSDEVGGTFFAWDEYISGTNKSLTENEEIVQFWRTNEFQETDEDSILILRFKGIKEECELTLIHNNIPEGQSDYAKGWIDHYFTPMKEYFK